MTLDGEDVEAVAHRVIELLEEQRPAGGLVDATTAARLLGVSRATVYEKKEELGAIRVGSGKRPRLRFDPKRLTNATAAAPAARGRRRRATATRDGLLPIKGRDSARRPLRS